MQVSNINIKTAVIRVLARIISNFPESYFNKDNNQIDSSSNLHFFHTLIEILLYPLTQSTTRKLDDDLLLCSLQSLQPLSLLLTKSNLISRYSPIICYLLLHLNSSVYQQVILHAQILALSSFIQSDSSSQTLTSCLFTLFDGIPLSSSALSTIFISLLSSNHSNSITQNFHDKILSHFISLLNDEKQRENIISIILSWFNRSTSSTPSNVMLWYLNQITSWIICFLLQIHSISQENFVLDCIKILVISHTFCNSRKLKIILL